MECQGDDEVDITDAILQTAASATAMTQRNMSHRLRHTLRHTHFFAKLLPTKVKRPDTCCLLSIMETLIPYLP